MKLSHKILLALCLFIAGYSYCQKCNAQSVNGKTALSPAEEKQRIKADNDFTLKLFKNLISTNTYGANVFASPLGVSFALGLAGNGSAGQTRDAFKNTLNFDGLTQSQLNNHYDNLVTRLPHLDPATKFDIANSMWYKQGFTVLPRFLETGNRSFHAKIQAIDFSDSSSVNTINSWINKQTDGNISSIINQIPSDAVMYLINAVYFKSSWNEKFDVSETQDMPFSIAYNKKVQASFMTGKIHCNYYEDTNALIIELPYTNSKFSMVIITNVPGGRGISLDDLNSTQWETWMADLYPAERTIKMPKFKFSYGVNLKNALIDLGLNAAFSDAADFSLINPDGHLKISEVLHKAYIETDENGSTATATTSVRLGSNTAVPPQPPIVIDHPFVFAIREMSSGLIVFTGMVNNPLLTGD
jgi:serpin B